MRVFTRPEGLSKALEMRDAPAIELCVSQLLFGWWLTDHLKGLSGGETQDWPDDAAFQKAWLELNTYKALRTAKTKTLLEALELGSRNDVHHESAVLPSVALHVEHVLPVAREAHWPSPGDDGRDGAQPPAAQHRQPHPADGQAEPVAQQLELRHQAPRDHQEPAGA